MEREVVKSKQTSSRTYVHCTRAALSGDTRACVRIKSVGNFYIHARYNAEKWPFFFRRTAVVEERQNDDGGFLFFENRVNKRY